jgi:hypothetical protein
MTSVRVTSQELTVARDMVVCGHCLAGHCENGQGCAEGERCDCDCRKVAIP